MSQVHLIGRDERTSDARAASARHTTNAMHEQLGLGGEVVVDDGVQHGNVCKYHISNN